MKLASIDWASMKWDSAGLVTVVVQDRFSGEVRMLAHANREALEATLEGGLACFFSRSRNQFWQKGETSGNTLAVSEVWIDCDGDAVLYLVDPAGPSCHTGKPSCFFSRLPAGDDGRAHSTLPKLWETLDARRQQAGAKSYTRKLLDEGADHIGGKIREEADELARAIASETPERVISETADVLYHVLVGLLHRDVDLREVMRELDRRFGMSGLEEKAARPRSSDEAG